MCKLADMCKLARMSMNISIDAPLIPEFSVEDRLRKAREAARLTQEDLALRIGVTRRTLVRWEQGLSLKKSVILLYAMSTGVPSEWIETGKCTPRDLNPEPTDFGSVLRGPWGEVEDIAA